MERIVCPNCGFEATSDDFVCPRCEVLLNEAAAELEAVSVVQALLSPSNAPPGRGAPPKNPEVIGDRATVRATVLMDECTVPHMLAGVDLALTPLHQFEAYVTSHVDGAQSVPEIAQKAGITKIEAMAVFQSLAFRRVVELRRTEPPRAAPPQQPEPEPVAPAPPLGDDEDEPKTDPAAAPISEEMLAAARAAASAAVPAASAPAEEPMFDLGPAFGAPAAKPAASPTATTVPARPAVAARTAQPPGAGKPAGRRPPAPAFDLGPAFASGEASEPPPKPLAPPSPKLSPMRPSPPRLAPARPATTSQPAPAPTPAPPRKLPLEDYKPKASPPKPENVIERAVALEQKGDVEGAIAVLKRAIAQVKNPAPLYNKMALVLIKRKEFTEAVALLEKASALEPENTVFQQNLYKAVGLVAASKGSGPKRSPGLISKLLRGK